MTIITKFTPGDTAWFIHPYSGALVNTTVLGIEISVDSFGAETVLNLFAYGNLQFYINDNVAFATQAELVAAYSAQDAITDTGALIITGIAPTISIALP